MSWSENILSSLMESINDLCNSQNVIHRLGVGWAFSRCLKLGFHGVLQRQPGVQMVAHLHLQRHSFHRSMALAVIVDGWPPDRITCKSVGFCKTIEGAWSRTLLCTQNLRKWSSLFWRNFVNRLIVLAKCRGYAFMMSHNCSSQCSAATRGQRPTWIPRWQYSAREIQCAIQNMISGQIWANR